MIEITKSSKTLLILFICFFVVSFALLQLAGKTSRPETNLNGYFQLVENASIPILLADQKEQFSLQIGALIQDTPIAQVRIYDNSEALLFRVQNSSTPSNDNAVITLRNPLFFENSEAGFLEVELDPKIASPGAGTLFGSLAIALLLALLCTLSFYFLSPADKTEKIATREDIDSNPAQSRQAPARLTASTAEPHILIFVKTLLPAHKPGAEANPLEQISRASETISEMARIYAAEPVATAANSLAFSIRGKASNQSVHQATMLCWGLAQLQPDEDIGAESDLEIQSFVINPEDLSTEDQLSLPYWTEIDMRCDAGKAAGAFVAKSLTDRVDTTAFELTPPKGDFFRINDASSSIKKLWQNQRAQRENNS